MENTIKIENTEIRDQAHLMVAEGACDDKPTLDDIVNFLSEHGFVPNDIDVSYDTMQGFWRWNCNIQKLTV